MLFRNFGRKRSNPNGHSNCDCRRTTSPIPIVNRMLRADPLDAITLQMEMEFMTSEEVQHAFGLDMSADEYVEKSWRNSWEQMGATLRCVMRKRLDSLSESDRSRIEHLLEQ